MSRKFLKMKYFLAVLVCALAAASLARPEIDKEDLRQRGQKLKQIREKCQADPATAIDESALKNLEKGGPLPANIGPHSLCISKGVGWQNEDGSVNKAHVESSARAVFGDSANIDQIVEECVAPQPNSEATALHLFKCYRDHFPNRDGSARHQH